MAAKLWQGRFRESTSQLVEGFTASIRFDKRLYRYDIQGSMAHCRMLAQQRLLSQEEADTLIQGLGEILREIERGTFVFDDSALISEYEAMFDSAEIARVGAS